MQGVSVSSSLGFGRKRKRKTYLGSGTHAARGKVPRLEAAVPRRAPRRIRISAGTAGAFLELGFGVRASSVNDMHDRVTTEPVSCSSGLSCARTHTLALALGVSIVVVVFVVFGARCRVFDHVVREGGGSVVVPECESAVPAGREDGRRAGRGGCYVDTGHGLGVRLAVPLFRRPAAAFREDPETHNTVHAGSDDGVALRVGPTGIGDGRVGRPGADSGEGELGCTGVRGREDAHGTIIAGGKELRFVRCIHGSDPVVVLERSDIGGR